MAKRAYLASCFLVTIAITVASIWWHRDQAVIHAEHSVTVPHFLSHPNVLKLMFDPVHTEAPPSPANFQARELSYFFDYLDVRAMAWSAYLGVAHSLSVVEYGLILLLTGLMWLFFMRDLKLGTTVSFLLIAIFLTTPSIFLTGIQHRTAKIDTAFTVGLSIAWSWWLLFRFKVKRPAVLWSVSVLLFLSLTLVDMQGFYFVMVGTLLSLPLLAVQRDLRTAILSSSLLAASLLHFWYKVRLGPELIHFFNGYYPLMTFQTPELVDEKVKSDLYGSFFLLLDYIRFTFGSMSEWGVACAVFALGLCTFEFPPLSKRRERIVRSLKHWSYFLVFGALLFMLFLMVQKFPAVYRTDLRRLYYPQPMTVIFIFGLALFLAPIRGAPALVRRAFAAVFAVILAANIFALPVHQAIIEECHCETSTKPDAEERVFALRHLWDQDYVVPQKVKDDPVYQAVREFIERHHGI